MSFFRQAVDLTEDERAALLSRVDDQEPSLGVDLRALLVQDAARDDLFDSVDGRLDLQVPDDEWLTETAPLTVAAPSRAALPAGSVIADRYQLEELVGHGAMGNVYRAYDPVAEREVALKLLRADLMHDPRQVLRFRREFRAISRLDHPGCVAVYEEGRHEAQRYIVMEYVAGGNLGRLSGSGSEVLLPILIDLTRTLAYVHGRRVIHRDLKPANVLLTDEPQPRPRLADFGIVNLSDEFHHQLTESGVILGTIDYLAPEQLDGHPPDPRSDLFALGCVIFELWAGRPPFIGTPLQRLRSRLDREAPPLRSLAEDVPTFLDDLVARLLQRDPAARPQHAGEVARTLSDHWARSQNRSLPSLATPPGLEPLAGAYLYNPGLIGREQPLRALQTHIEAQVSGAKAAALVVVEGEAGVGKSRLLSEAVESSRRRRQRGTHVIQVQCRSAMSAPFAPFPAMLAEIDEALKLAGANAPPARGGNERSASARTEHSQASRLPGDDAVVARRRLARELVDKLQTLQQRAPVLLVIEDLHDATDSARALLGALLATLPGDGASRPAVLATTRPEGRAPLETALRERVELLWLVLEPLAPVQVAEIAATMLAVTASGVPPALLAHLQRIGGGNPLLVQSELRALVDRGDLLLASSGWELRADALSEHGFAEGTAVRDLLATLSAATRSLLSAAAMCGPRFDTELLCQVTRAHQDAVIDAIDEAVRASVVQPVHGPSPQDEYAFEHDRLAEAVRAELDAEQRTRLHDAIGAALVARGDASQATLAFHFSRGSDPVRAYEHLHAAARAASEACDFDAARRHLHSALEQVEHLPEDRREHAHIECTELLADALIVLGHPHEGIAALDRLPVAGVPPVVQARWLRKRGLARLRTNQVAEGLQQLQQALTVLGDPLPRSRFGRSLRMVRDLALTLGRWLLRRRPAPRDPALEERALVHRELGVLSRWIDLERSAAHLVAFIRLAHRLGVAALRVEAYAGAALILSLRSWRSLAAWSDQRARGLAESSGDLRGLARVHVVRGGAATFIACDDETVLGHFREGLRLAERTGDRFLMIFALSMRGWATTIIGHTAQAFDDFDRADALAAELEVPWMREDAACGRSLLSFFHGDPRTVAHTARRLLASDLRVALPVFEAFANEMLGGDAFVNGRFRAAVNYFELARAHFRLHHLYRGWGLTCKLLYGEALLCLADEEGAHAVPDLLVQLRPLMGWSQRAARLSPFHGCDLLMRGVYAARRGRERRARAYFARARAQRAGRTHDTYIDLWLHARITIEGLHIGDPREQVSASLDDLDRRYESIGATGMRSWLTRIRSVLGV